MDFGAQLAQIDVCAVGVLRVTSACLSVLTPGSKVVVVSSQAGSVAWRATQSPRGGEYGHHMSRAACNMAAVLLARELFPRGVAVALLHPGFVRTDMTRKYAHLWDEEGAVEPEEGAMRVLYEAQRARLDASVVLINCEDGLRIPW
jgi:NAD(P)-dependent dehydrogenase (short-subunit alcohol dehydrogenase family)